jgi:hypothetical protein
MRYVRLREAEGVFRERWWVWCTETVQGSTNFGEKGVINLQAKVVEELGARLMFVLKLPCLIKLGMGTCLDDAGRKIEVLNILVSA